MEPTFSPGVLSVLPIFYIGWSDSVLSPSEMRAIQDYLRQLPLLTEADKKLLLSWTDQRNPPDKETFAAWAKAIQHYAGDLSATQRQSLVDVGIEMARKAASIHDAQQWADPQARAAVAAFEEMMGVDDVTSHRAFFNAVAPQHSTELDERPGFHIQTMQQQLEGRFADIKQHVRTLLQDETFRIPTDLCDKEALRTLILSQCKELARQGYGMHGFPSVYGGKADVAGGTAIFETLAMGNLSLLIKYGVQFGLFGGAVYQLGTQKHHDAYLRDLGNLDLPGCFAMTETGHGSNVRDLETTATYDHGSRTLVIHSPARTAGKEYIGNALHSRMAAVFCQLMVAGENHGIHAVLVPLRDAEHRLLPGIEVKDNGYKMGLNGVDNGQIWFDQVRVPVENLLNRYGDIDAQGRYNSPIANPSRRFFTMLGALVGGRVSVALASNTAAKKALDIAIRYGLQRRQFNTLSEERETLLLDYATHQERLFPLLAKSYALTFALEVLREQYAASLALEDKRAVEALAAGLKSYASWHATGTIQECREACGGKGYLAENELPGLKADTDIFTTFEGDNHVLLQLLAKSLLTDFKQEFSDGGYWAIARHLLQRVTNDWVETNPFSARNTDSEHLLDAAFHTQALSLREQKLLFSLSDRMRGFMQRKLNPGEIFLRTQTHMVALALAHVEQFVHAAFHKFIANMPESAEKEALERLRQCYALHTIYQDRAWYLENDYITGEKSKAIRKVLAKLYRQIRPDALGYVSAFGIPRVLRNVKVLETV